MHAQNDEQNEIASEGALSISGSGVFAIAGE